MKKPVTPKQRYDDNRGYCYILLIGSIGLLVSAFIPPFEIVNFVVLASSLILLPLTKTIWNLNKRIYKLETEKEAAASGC